MRAKKGFTLAELMIVLLIVTILLAAFAPMITKRIRAANGINYNNVWNWVGSTTSMDAFFATRAKTNTGMSYFNINGSKEDLLSVRPYGRLIIQGIPQISFYTTDTDSYLGSWIMDRSNVLVGARQKPGTDAKNNTSFGYRALASLTTGRNNTAVGGSSWQNITSGSNNTGVGDATGSGNTGNNNTCIGEDACYYSSNGGAYDNNTCIGHEACRARSGNNNTFVGGNSHYPAAGSATGSLNNDVGIGYNALHALKTGNYNVAYGAKALENLETGDYNVAIGYNACGELTSGSYVTCIGANSGPHTDTTSATAGIHTFDESHQRTYIGGKPHNFGGDAVLEIHNLGIQNGSLLNGPTAAPNNSTTVINGNLMVKGKVYFTFGNDLYDTSTITLGSNTYLSAVNKCATTDQNSSGVYTFNTGGACSYLPKISSDRRLKNNITKNSDGIDKILQLNVYDYNFKDDKTKKPQVGVLAQELQKIFPNSVSEDKDGYLKIRWDEMFFAMVNAIKDINHKIVQAVKDVVTLESKITKLEKENQQLQAKTNELNLRLKNLKH